MALYEQASDIDGVTGATHSQPVAAYTSSHVANFFIRRSEEEDMPITQLKLLKLVYIAYGWVAAILDRRLFEERIEAWQHGPVVESLYHEFKHYGKQPIDSYSICYDLESEKMSFPEIPKSDEDTLRVLHYVWEIYKRFSAWDLRNKTHEKDTPWSKAYVQGFTGVVIPHESIKEHFSRKIREYLDE